MKQKLLFLSLFVLLISCSKSEESATTEKTTNITYKSPELDFYGIPNKSLTNIQVGDMIKINFEISTLKDVDFIEVQPISKATSYHELLNTDYELYIPSETEKDKFTKVNSLKMKKGINIYYIKPLLPGTFQLKFEEVTKTFKIEAPITFSAVKISTRIEASEGGICDFIKRTKWHTYRFSIDSGNQYFDLLFNENGASYTYEIVYRGTNKSGTFTAKSDLELISSISECGDYPSVDHTITSIIIYKTIAGNKQVVATYNNVGI